MLTFYNFVLQLNAWLTRNSSVSAEDVRLVNEYFGPWLVGTMLKHRIIACMLKRTDRSQHYFRRNYGLQDETYTGLVDVLLSDLVARDRLSRIHKKAFLIWDNDLKDYSASLHATPPPA